MRPQLNTIRSAKGLHAPGFWGLILFLLAFRVPLPAQTWLEIVASSDQTLEKVLRTFDLDVYECNQSEFYRLNETRTVKKGNTYLVPIQIVEYNGKSIRSTLNIEDWRVAKRIEQYNRKALKDGWRTDDFVESRDLWVPFHELNCPPGTKVKKSQKVPNPAVTAEVIDKANNWKLGEAAFDKGGRSFAIFGSAYQKTPLVSRRLKGKIFYLISGHAGPDPGAQGRRAGNLLCEDEYAYDVTLRLMRLLLSHDATVYMIVRDPNDGIRDQAYLSCDKDEVVWGKKAIPRDQKERLTQRTDIVNALMEKHLAAGRTNQTLIEIHVDSRHDDKKIDVFFYHRPQSEASEILAERFHQTFKDKYRQAQGGRGYNGSVSSRHLHTLKETSTRRAVYIELGNIQNDWDQQRIVLKNNRQALANWLCQALLSE